MLLRMRRLAGPWGNRSAAGLISGDPMRDMSVRPQRLKIRRRPPLAGFEAVDQSPLRAGWHLWPMLRAGLRCLAIVVWTLLAMPVQAILLVLPGRGKVGFARLYWAVVCRLLGLRVRVIGVPVRGQPVVFVSNHSSWLDIPVLGGRLKACFVSKGAVARWPVVGIIARLGRTVFVSRQRQATGRERDDMKARMARGDNLLLFPEGTSSDGVRVLPFRSAFFALAESEAPPLIQPVSVVYDRIGGLPMLHANRSVFAWYGDMALAPHFWRLAQLSGCRASLLLHPPIDPRTLAGRKVLAQAAWQSVAEGAAMLRQNRPPRPHKTAPTEALVPA